MVQFTNLLQHYTTFLYMRNFNLKLGIVSFFVLSIFETNEKKLFNSLLERIKTYLMQVLEYVETKFN